MIDTGSDNAEVIVKVCFGLMLISFLFGMLIGAGATEKCVSTVTDMVTDAKAKERVYSCKRHDQKMTIDVIENGMRVTCTCKEKLCLRDIQSCTS